MFKLNFNKKLSPQTIGDILVYLEKRPLGEVYPLFQSIVTQLAEDPDGGTDGKRLSSTPSGSRDPDGGNHSVPSVQAESGGSGSEGGA